jgi:hypothetical protein
MRRLRSIHRVLLGTALSVSLPLFAQAPAPLPLASSAAGDVTTLLKEVRRRIPLDADLQSGYLCLQRETEVKLDGDGRPVSRTTKDYELYPSVGGTPPFRRLIARDGVPVPSAELAETDRRHQAELGASAAEQNKRQRQEAEDRRDRQALVDEFFRLFDFRIAGRETFNGRAAILVDFTPRAGLTASSRTASVAQKFAGRAWVDEQDLEVIRVDAKSTEDVNYGFGMFARIFKGTTVSWERRKVDDQAWVPARLEIRADARVLLFRRLGLHRITDYLNYRRWSGTTAPAR